MNDFHRCEPVSFRHRGKVKRVMNERVHRHAADHGHLPEMDQFGRVVTNNLESKNFPAVLIRNQLQQATGRRCNVSPGDLIVIDSSDQRAAHLLDGLLFRQPDCGYLRDRVNARRQNAVTRT